MNKIKLLSLLVLVVTTITLTVGFATPRLQDKNESSSAQEGKNAKIESASEDKFAPVDNMHHFMEYVCEPSYKGLKQIMENEPKDRQAWKAFKNHSLVLAETSALVAARGPEDPEKSKKWKQIALDVYTNGAALYKSAGKFEEAKKHYSAMIDNCNKCHTEFADGKHQLKK